jgi:general secretion pathway protein M
MRSARLEKQVWRYASLALFCGVPLLFFILIATNLKDTADARALEDRQRAQLSQIVARLASHPRRVLTLAEKASLYLDAKTVSLARAELQARTGKIVTAAGGRLSEAQFTGTSDQEANGTLAIQLALSIENKGLRDLLYDLEAGLPLMTVASLNVRKQTAEGADGGADGGPLQVEVTVHGYFKQAGP